MEYFSKKWVLVFPILLGILCKYLPNFALIRRKNLLKAGTVCYCCKCGKYRYSLSHFFRKNFVKAMDLLMKLLNSWFDEIFFSDREFLVFPHCVIVSCLWRLFEHEFFYFRSSSFTKASIGICLLPVVNLFLDGLHMSWAEWPLADIRLCQRALWTLLLELDFSLRLLLLFLDFVFKAKTADLLLEFFASSSW